MNKRGELLSENQYRLNMARKEHKKHVKDMLAQAIVHKSLDMERTRQVEIRRKLEEIAKIELVRRVRVRDLRITWAQYQWWEKGGKNCNLYIHLF